MKLNKYTNKFKKAKGFTLIEMVVVVAIIAILLLLVVPNVVKQKQHAQQRTNDAFKTTLQTQVELSEKKDAKWEDLEADGYLTKKQVERANKEGYTLKDGEVSGPEK